MDRINTDHGIFKNNEVTGETAEEVYHKWLENKDKPPLPSIEERLQIAEDTILGLMDVILMGGM